MVIKECGSLLIRLERRPANPARLPALVCNVYGDGCVAASNTSAHSLERARGTSRPFSLRRAARRGPQQLWQELLLAKTVSHTQAVSGRLHTHARQTRHAAALAGGQGHGKHSGVMRGKASTGNSVSRLGGSTLGVGDLLQARAPAACRRRSSAARPPQRSSSRHFRTQLRGKASQSPCWKATSLSKSARLPAGPFCRTRARAACVGQQEKVPSLCAGLGCGASWPDVAQGLRQCSARRSPNARNNCQGTDN